MITFTLKCMVKLVWSWPLRSNVWSSVFDHDLLRSNVWPSFFDDDLYAQMYGQACLMITSTLKCMFERVWWWPLRSNVWSSVFDHDLLRPNVGSSGFDDDLYAQMYGQACLIMTSTLIFKGKRVCVVSPRLTWKDRRVDGCSLASHVRPSVIYQDLYTHK